MPFSTHTQSYYFSPIIWTGRFVEMVGRFGISFEFSALGRFGIEVFLGHLGVFFDIEVAEISA